MTKKLKESKICCEEAVFATMLKNHGFDGNETHFQVFLMFICDGKLY